MKQNISLKHYGVLALIAMTIVWGTTFPAMKYLHSSLNALEIMGVRFTIAALILLPVWMSIQKSEITGGVFLGVVMFVAFYLQIEGLAHTTSNRNAFLTGLNVLLVPVLGLMVGASGVTNWRLWLSCIIAALGMALLFYENAAWNIGDTLTLVSAVAYAVYILLLERVAKGQRLRPTRLAAVQTVVVALCSMVFWLWSDAGVSKTFAALARLNTNGMLALLYLGVVASVVAVIIQAWGQQFVGALQSAIVYGLEPVFAALAAWVILGEVLSAWAFVGAGLIVFALIFSQLKREHPK